MPIAIPSALGSNFNEPGSNDSTSTPADAGSAATNPTAHAGTPAGISAGACTSEEKGSDRPDSQRRLALSLLRLRDQGEPASES